MFGGIIDLEGNAMELIKENSSLENLLLFKIKLFITVKESFISSERSSNNNNNNQNSMKMIVEVACKK